jgi:hypothetical protein
MNAVRSVESAWVISHHLFRMAPKPAGWPYSAIGDFPCLNSIGNTAGFQCGGNVVPVHKQCGCSAVRYSGLVNRGFMTTVQAHVGRRPKRMSDQEFAERLGIVPPMAEARDTLTGTRKTRAS